MRFNRYFKSTTAYDLRGDKPPQAGVSLFCTLFYKWARIIIIIKMEHVTHINTSHAIKFLHSLLVYVSWHEAFKFGIYMSANIYANDVDTIICVQFLFFHWKRSPWGLNGFKWRTRNLPSHSKMLYCTCTLYVHVHSKFIINSCNKNIGVNWIFFWLESILTYLMCKPVYNINL